MITKEKSSGGHGSERFPRNSSQSLSMSTGLSVPLITESSSEGGDTPSRGRSRTVTLACWRCGKTFEQALKDRRRTMRRHGKGENARANLVILCEPCHG